jgi:hypothetical protein
MISHAFVDSSVRNFELQLASGGFRGKVLVPALDEDYKALVEPALGYATVFDGDRSVVRSAVTALSRAHAVGIGVRASRKSNSLWHIVSSGRDNGLVQPNTCAMGSVSSVHALAPSTTRDARARMYCDLFVPQVTRPADSSISISNSGATLLK